MISNCASSGSQAAVGLFRWIGRSPRLINDTILLQATGMKYLSIYRCQNLGTLVSSMTVGGNRETGSSWSPDTPLAPTQTLPQYCLHNFWNWTLRIDQTSQETTSYPQIIYPLHDLFHHLSHQVGQDELVKVHCSWQSPLCSQSQNAKSMLFDLLV